MTAAKPAGRLQHIDGAKVWVIHDFLSSASCWDHIVRTETIGYAPAPITTARGPVMRSDIRNNRRVMIDDEPGAEALWAALKPSIATLADGVPPVGLNERLRYYRYDAGERFAPHCDGYYQRPDRLERSLYTFMVYLNHSFDGGETRFLDSGHVVVPKRGMALGFVHHLLHEGCAVSRGRKYVLRTDVMYDLTPTVDLAAPHPS